MGRRFSISHAHPTFQRERVQRTWATPRFHVGLHFRHPLARVGVGQPRTPDKGWRIGSRRWRRVSFAPKPTVGMERAAGVVLHSMFDGSYRQLFQRLHHAPPHFLRPNHRIPRTRHVPGAVAFRQNRIYRLFDGGGGRG